MLSHCSEIYFSFTDRVALFHYFRGGALCLLRVFLVSQRLRMSFAIHGWIFLLSLSSTYLAASCATPLMLSVRTFMSSSKGFRAASLLPILA